MTVPHYSTLDQRGSLFKARPMPKFGSVPQFIPLLNEKPLTIPLSFDLKVDQRALSKTK